MRDTTVYALIDTQDGNRVRYIGRTMCALSQRLWQHKYNRMPASDWIRANFHNIKIIPLEVVPFKPWAAGKAERRWIEHYRGLGHNPLNIWPRMEKALDRLEKEKQQ